MKILVTGATGLIGRDLIYRMLINGHEVKALARSPEKLIELPRKNVIKWHHDQIPPLSFLAGHDAVVHLAGEGIADQYWTKNRKLELWNSRVLGTKNLVTALSSLPPTEKPKVFISSSAIGFYQSIHEAQDEESHSSNGFLSELCAEWEKSAKEAETKGIRTVILRTGLVLSKKGGILSKAGLLMLGTGKQWMSWIHIEDIIHFILYAIENQKLNGHYNLTAPYPITHEEFTQSVAKTIGFPITLPVPASVLKIALGEMSSMILANQKVLPTKTLASGFKFKFEKIEDAIKDLIEGASILDHYFSVRQFIPRGKSEVFSFFGKAENLEILTPPWLNFHIQKKSTEKIEKGSLIDYQLKIRRVPFKWKTLISQWSPENSFTDEQLKGPYQKWHHEHTFEEVLGGTLISDNITFRLPGWFFGKMLLPFVKKDINQIFEYRQEKIKSIYSQEIVE